MFRVVFTAALGLVPTPALAETFSAKLDKAPAELVVDETAKKVTVREGEQVRLSFLIARYDQSEKGFRMSDGDGANSVDCTYTGDATRCDLTSSGKRLGTLEVRKRIDGFEMLRTDFTEEMDQSVN